MTCGIYMIRNKVNNKIYIGQAVDIEMRWRNHKNELRGNYHPNKHLQNAWNKDGEDNFEFTIICECDENQLNTMEEYYIFELMTYNDKVGYNKTFGGGGCKATEETKKKMSEALKGKFVGENNPMYGKTGERAPMYGKTHSEEVRKKISEAKKGENNSFYGKTHSEEVRKKLSEANKGENNPNYGKRGAKNPRSIPVVQLTLDRELVEVYGSLSEAKRSGFTSSNINVCVKGKKETYRGYKWMYLHDYISNIHPNIKTINLFGKTYEVNQEEVKIG